VLLLMVADLVRKLFRPIAELSREVDQRSEQDLHPVDDQHLPLEVRPFAVAINRLLARVDQSMASQRRFVADAAHELRSPLTALSLQAERLAAAEMSGPARERLIVLRQGIERGRNLLDQLLALARTQSPTDSPPARVGVQGIYRRVLEDLMPLAEARHIDIGVDGAEDAEVWALELDVTALVRNLVDNAIRYTPPGGVVLLSVHRNREHVVLAVQDSGPGLDPAEYDKVFMPFYRAAAALEINPGGTGLGLAIVRDIATVHGATLGLARGDDGRGLKVTVTFSAA